ncbi:hypothetical protein GCM10007235_25130 [Pseudoxanthomonas indica]|nr:hypothetical protein GCM10007235_25130 [Pseudoxanthomonas indica]
MLQTLIYRVPRTAAQLEDEDMIELNEDELALVSGGGLLGVSGETWGCAIGGAIGARGGPWGSAAGCIAGAAIANWASSPYDGGMSIRSPAGSRSIVRYLYQ